MVSIPLYPHDIRMFHSHAPKIAANFAKAGRSNVFRINSINLHRWFREKSSHPQNIWIYDANCVYIYIYIWGVYVYIYIYVCVYMYMCGKYAYINILYIYVWDMYMVYIYIYSLCMGYIHGIYI